MNVDWLAGFYEGEGYPRVSTGLVIDVYQKDRDVEQMALADKERVVKASERASSF